MTSCSLQRPSQQLCGVVLACVLAATLAAESKPRPVLPGSIATLKGSRGGGGALLGPRDNQTMTAVLDARRAIMAAANESRSAKPQLDQDAVGQGDGDDDEEQHPTAVAATTEEDDQGDEHRPQNHRVVEPGAPLPEGHFAPSMELGPIPDQYGFEGPTRHIHIHQHHLGAGRGAATGVATGAGATAPSGAGATRRPLSPAQTPGLSHYRAGSGPSGPSGPSAHHPYHQHQPHSYKPVKFESEEQHYSVHEDQDHHHYPHQQAVHAAIAAAHPTSHPVAGAATGELAVGIGLGAGLSEGLGVGSLASSPLGGGALDGGDGGGLQYPLLGAAPYDTPKVLPHASEPLLFPHKPKELKKGKSHSLWRSALRVVAGLAPLALLVAAIQPNVLVIDPRLGTRQRSSGSRLQRCEQRAVCEVALVSGPHVLQALLINTPPGDAQSMDLGTIAKAVEAKACGRFACEEYDARANLTATLVTPGPSNVATTPMTGSFSDIKTVVRKHKRKKVVRNSTNSSEVSTTEPPP